VPVPADVAVIGGGLLGAATAYWLARAGRQVVLLERTGLAYGATGRNGGFVMASTAEAYPEAIKRLGHEEARAILRLTRENRELLRQVLAEEEIACDYREPGNLHLAVSEAQFEEARRSVEALQADACPALLLDRGQVQRLIGTELGEEIVGGAFLPDLGLVHSARLIQGLAVAAQRHGARIYRADVQQITAHGDGVSIQTAQRTLQAGSVVVAVNAWTDTLVPAMKGLIVPVRGQALAYAPISPVFPMGIGVAVTATGEYWQQTLDGSIVLGGCREVAPEHEVGMRESRPTEEVQEALERVFPRLFPRLDGLRVERRWAGLMAFTPDYVPIADSVPGIPKAWIVGGFCGHGMPFGMRLGQLLAESVTSGITANGLHPLRLKRPTLNAASDFLEK